MSRYILTTQTQAIAKNSLVSVQQVSVAHWAELGALRGFTCQEQRCERCCYRGELPPPEFFRPK